MSEKVLGDSDRLKLKRRGKAEDFKTLRPRQPSNSQPHYEKRKPRPRQPSNRLKLKKRGKAEDFKTLRPRQPSDSQPQYEKRKLRPKQPSDSQTAKEKFDRRQKDAQSRKR